MPETQGPAGAAGQTDLQLAQDVSSRLALGADQEDMAKLLLILGIPLRKFLHPSTQAWLCRITSCPWHHQGDPRGPVRKELPPELVPLQHCWQCAAAVHVQALLGWR